MNTELLKSRVKGIVRISHFQEDVLWYVCEDGYEFPAPLEDTRNAQGGQPRFDAEAKGITFMRWVRKHMSSEKESCA